MPPIHREAGALGLGDLYGLKVFPEIVDEVPGVVAVVRGQGHYAVVDNPQYLHLVEVDHRDDALDRAGIAVVVGAGAEPTQRIGQPHPLFAIDPVVSRRPGIYHHEVYVGDAPSSQGLPEGRVLLDRLLALVELVQHDFGLDAGDVIAGLHGVLGERDDSLVGAAGVVVQDADKSLTRQAIRPVVGQDVVLGWFVEDDSLVPHPRPDGLVPVQYSHGADYLTRGEGIEWMGGRGPSLGGFGGLLQGGHRYLPARLNEGDSSVYMSAHGAFNKEWGGDACVAAPPRPAETYKPSSVSA